MTASSTFSGARVAPFGDTAEVVGFGLGEGKLGFPTAGFAGGDDAKDGHTRSQCSFPQVRQVGAFMGMC